MKILDLSNASSLDDRIYLKAFDSLIKNKKDASALKLHYKSIVFFPKISLSLDTYHARIELLNSLSKGHGQYDNGIDVIKIKYLSDLVVLRKKLGSNANFVGISGACARSLYALIRPFAMFSKSFSQSFLCWIIALIYTKKRTSKIHSAVYGYVSDSDFSGGQYTERYLVCELLKDKSPLSIYVPLLPVNNLLTPVKFAKSQGKLALFREREIGLFPLLLADFRLLLLMYYKIIKSTHAEAVSNSFTSSLFEAVKNIEFVFQTSWNQSSVEVALWYEDQTHQKALLSAMPAW